MTKISSLSLGLFLKKITKSVSSFTVSLKLVNTVSYTIFVYTIPAVYKTEYKTTVHIISYQSEWHFTIYKQLPSKKFEKAKWKS